ncbi:MAG: hypothetical protein A3G24_26550 [Betaproteobacteria bacterium RIFCSPLOWO2_12_FULL_62_13]|nr:MAG: hypothetical protein A3G24_26550 [Betaproteobacteria bacterium RIFCSPLOWO2_12_FULL_62_13]
MSSDWEKIERISLITIHRYWQTETGWPILTSVPGVQKTPVELGSPRFPAFGYHQIRAAIASAG